QVAFINHSRSDLALGSFESPDALALGYVAASSGLDRDGGSAAWAAGCCEDHAVAPHRRSVDVGAKAFAQPELSAAGRIEGCEASGSAEDNFLMACCIDYNGRAPRGALLRPSTEPTATTTHGTAAA